MTKEREYLLSERYHKYLACCQGKEAFESRALAEIVNRRRRLRGNHTHAYKCTACGKYHIGHSAYPKTSRDSP